MAANDVCSRGGIRGAARSPTPIERVHGARTPSSVNTSPMRKATVPLPLHWLRDPLHLLALGFGSGYAPKAPGTFGTLTGVAIYLLAQSLPLAWYVAFTTLGFALGVWACGRAARDLGVHDHPGIVWDEVIGYLVTMTAAPQGAVWVLAGFLLFRLFDIVKPWPISWLDRRVQGGAGIMIDDLAAGFMAMATLQVIAKLY